VPEVLFCGSEERVADLPAGSISIVSTYERSELVRRRPGSTPVIVRVSYRGTPIAAGILGEDLDGLHALLPFAGGLLDPEGFAASTYVAPGAAAPAVATLVIVREPRLSELERRALVRLPRAMSDMAGDSRLDCRDPVARLVELRAERVLAGRLR
jgi:hypothetical protein